MGIFVTGGDQESETTILASPCHRARSARTGERVPGRQGQDFNLYYATGYGFSPSKIAYLSPDARKDIECGAWPANTSGCRAHAYDLSEIKHQLRVFLHRFFQLSQLIQAPGPCPMARKSRRAAGSPPPAATGTPPPADATATVWREQLEATSGRP